MVDYDLFASILEKSKEGYIESGDHLDERTIELFIKHGIGNIKQLFKKEEGAYFFADVKCSCCGKVKLISRFSNDSKGSFGKKSKCKECIKK